VRTSDLLTLDRETFSMTRIRSVPALLIGSGAMALALSSCGAASVGSKLVALSKDSPSDASSSKQVTVSCPKGKFALGGGAHLHFPGEPGGVVPLAITISRPDPDASTRPTGWVAAGNATGAYRSSWGIEVHVVCSS